MKLFDPVIKWSGSKRSQARDIVLFSPRFETYYEPFLGGGSVLYALSPERAVCGDICAPLIALWELLKTDPERLCLFYEENWIALQNDYMTYYRCRDHFNETKSPMDLLFLSRTCVNGLIRFNGKGDFNNSLHYTRKGIAPDRLRKIIYDWSGKIQNVQFINGDYRQTTASATANDFVYLDPPYFNTKGRYYGKIDYDEFYAYLEQLNRLGVKFALSFDGECGDRIYETSLPKELFKRQVKLRSGKSAFKKVIDNRSEEVYESLYLNWE